MAWNVTGGLALVLLPKFVRTASSEMTRTCFSREENEAKCTSAPGLERSRAVTVARNTPHCPSSMLVANNIRGPVAGADIASFFSFLLLSFLCPPWVVPVSSYLFLVVRQDAEREYREEEEKTVGYKLLRSGCIQRIIAGGKYQCHVRYAVQCWEGLVST